MMLIVNEMMHQFYALNYFQYVTVIMQRKTQGLVNLALLVCLPKFREPCMTLFTYYVTFNVTRVFLPFELLIPGNLGL